MRNAPDQARLSAPGLGDADGAGHAVGTVVAVPAGVLVEVLLVVVLGVEELAGPGDLGGDRRTSGGLDDRVERLPRGECRDELLLGRGVDRRPVLRARVIALP